MMASLYDNHKAFTAFESQLRTLCLNEFPCGNGTWRDNFKKSSLQTDNVLGKYAVTLKDYIPNFEKTETLEELISVKHSPWNLDYSWSSEAKRLREIAVQSPWLIDQNFILDHFRSLRIVDKAVTDVDEQFLGFTNLEELTLSANFLQSVNSSNLPRNLKVLELCANNISNLADLCIKPPPLTHLGLGCNQLILIDDYITGEYWPELLSVDLGHNHLCDLLDIVRRLQTLPKLRNLILQGNPLSLVPAYRGYIIDSLRMLDFLDDLSISADERHHYKGLTKRREYILDEAKVTLKVNYIRGLPVPEEIMNADEQPEFPVITRKYFIRFQFLEDKSTDAEIFQILYDDQYSMSSDTHPAHSAQTLSHTVDAQDVASSTEKNVNFADDIATLQSHRQESSRGSQMDSHVDDISEHMPTPSDAEESSPPTEGEKTPEADEGHVCPLKLSSVESEKSSWMEEIELNWSKLLIRDDIRALRDFFKAGMDLTVVEEKIESFPAEQMQDVTVSPQSKDTKGKKKDDKGKDSKKGREKSPKGKSPQRGKTPPKAKVSTPKKEAAKDDGKKKKKKGEPEVELSHMPPEYATLASFHVPLHQFLEGDFEYENVFMEGGDPDYARKMLERSSAKKDKKDKDKKKKDGKDGKKSPPGKGDKKGDKDKKGKGQGQDGGQEEDENAPPPPLEVHVGVKLHHWKTTVDALKQEELQQDQMTVA